MNDTKQKDKSHFSVVFKVVSVCLGIALLLLPLFSCRARPCFMDCTAGWRYESEDFSLDLVTDGSEIGTGTYVRNGESIDVVVYVVKHEAYFMLFTKEGYDAVGMDSQGWTKEIQPYIILDGSYRSGIRKSVTVNVRNDRYAEENNLTSLKDKKITLRRYELS